MELAKKGWLRLWIVFTIVWLCIFLSIGVYSGYRAHVEGMEANQAKVSQIGLVDEYVQISLYTDIANLEARMNQFNRPEDIDRYTEAKKLVDKANERVLNSFLKVKELDKAYNSHFYRSKLAIILGFTIPIALILLFFCAKWVLLGFKNKD